MPVAARKAGGTAALGKKVPPASAAPATAAGAAVKRTVAAGVGRTDKVRVAAALVGAENAENDVHDDEDSMITDDDRAAQDAIDMKYNPELLASILSDLEKQVQLKCLQIQKDADFMATSIQQAFHLELIKLPTQVKQMSLARFRSEFGDSLEAVTRGGSRSYSSISGGGSSSSSGSSSGSSSSSAVKSVRSSSRVFETPSSRRSARMSVAQTPSSRNPREGEMLLSANGSPLGEFQTVVKAGRPGPKIAVPATPGLFVPLQTGDVLDMDNADIDSMSQDVKQDALAKMQEMMANMQALMDKLKN